MNLGPALHSSLTESDYSELCDLVNQFWLLAHCLTVKFAEDSIKGHARDYRAQNNYESLHF